MKTSLINYTGYGFSDPEWFAICLLIFAKRTRVEMDADGFSDILVHTTRDEAAEELRYIANTIPGSWEMVDYTFLCNDVSRAFTHQLVRTRTASYAQQTMQILDVSGFGYVTGDSIAKDAVLTSAYRGTMKKIDEVYRWLLQQGAEVEHARGLLPTAIHTNIIAKMNLRTFVDLYRSRCGPRNADETSVIVKSMCENVLLVHPFAKLFLQSDADDAASQLDALIGELNIEHDRKNVMLKMVDRMRRRT